MTEKLPDDEKMVRAWFRCKPDLLAWIEEQAKKANRPRSSMIERMLFRAMTEQLKVEVLFSQTEQSKELTPTEEQYIKEFAKRKELL